MNASDDESFSFTVEEIEKLAKLEHERRFQERLQQGWRFAPRAKDNARNICPYLVPFFKLPNEIKELDRNTVRKLPLFLAKAGFQVRRQVSKWIHFIIAITRDHAIRRHFRFLLVFAITFEYYFNSNMRIDAVNQDQRVHGRSNR